MKKKTRRKLKKALKSVGKGLKQLEPVLGGRVGALAAGGATAGGLILAAARDPRIQESARELASAIGDFLKRGALGDTDAAAPARAPRRRADERGAPAGETDAPRSHERH